MDLVSSGVRELRERSIVDGDGVEREIDTLVLATGFKPAELPIAERVRGREGSSLAERLGRQPRGLPRHDRRGVPELPVPLRAEREPGPQLDRVHAGVADRVRPRRPRNDAANGRGGVPPASRGPGRLQRRAPGAARSTASGTPAAAAAGTSTATAATRSCGPASRSSTAAAPSTSTRRRTGWRRAPPRRPSALRLPEGELAGGRRRDDSAPARRAFARLEHDGGAELAGAVGGLVHVLHLHVGKPQRPAARRTRRCRRRARRPCASARYEPLGTVMRSGRQSHRPRVERRARPRGRPCAARGARLALSSAPIDPACGRKLIGTKVPEAWKPPSSTPPEPATRPPSPG